MDATKRPWVVHPGFPAEIYTADFRRLVAVCSTEERASLIVTACNHFEEMVEALELAVKILTKERGDYSPITALLAKVKEK